MKVAKVKSKDKKWFGVSIEQWQPPSSNVISIEPLINNTKDNELYGFKVGTHVIGLEVVYKMLDFIKLCKEEEKNDSK